MEPEVLSISHLAAISKEILIVSSDLLPPSDARARPPASSPARAGPAGPLRFAKCMSCSNVEEIFAAAKLCAPRKAIALNRPLTATRLLAMCLCFPSCLLPRLLSVTRDSGL